MRILVTGGAGFIGSNIVENLLKDANVSFVRVLDNLATGSLKNLSEFTNNPKFQLIIGDIRDVETCIKACENIDAITHQAALGSVPRSINDPLTSNNVNITGMINMMWAAKQNGIRRFVFAASSSTYGDSPTLPKVENVIGKPLSPYAITKYVNELYADIFSKFYGIEYVGLRYFNVFGPKQSPNGAYAAVIPLFMNYAIQQKAPTINGPGDNSRDFTFVANAVQANILALFTQNTEAINQIYNVACGEQNNLVQLNNYIKEISGSKADAIHGPERAGDVKHSLADISKIKQHLGYNPTIKIKEGLKITYDWYVKNMN
jgi:UDP-N-acetylglucosamine 4-epimerase